MSKRHVYAKGEALKAEILSDNVAEIDEVSISSPYCYKDMVTFDNDYEIQSLIIRKYKTVIAKYVIKDGEHRKLSQQFIDSFKEEYPDYPINRPLDLPGIIVAAIPSYYSKLNIEDLFDNDYIDLKLEIL